MLQGHGPPQDGLTIGVGLGVRRPIAVPWWSLFWAGVPVGPDMAGAGSAAGAERPGTQCRLEGDLSESKAFRQRGLRGELVGSLGQRGLARGLEGAGSVRRRGPGRGPLGPNLGG